ncbi:MAG: T9SS type A sorting domain-containing protein, partial [Crocinitomicaceae bacterium]|nr:T9SS type A sorting domain-containing protein [Crocinitomicaceae bacterium]
YGMISAIEIMNDSVTSGSYGVDVYTDDYDVMDVIVDNMYIDAYDYGLFVGAYYNVDNISITNCEVYGDTLGNGFDYGIMVESDDSWDVTNITIEHNNSHASSYGIYIGGDYLANISASHNNVKSTNDGINLNGVSENIKVDSNMVYANAYNGTSIYSGIALGGDANNVSVQGNYIDSYNQYGILLSDLDDDVTVQDNEMHSYIQVNSSWGIYAQYMGGVNNVINKNKIFTENENAGVYLINDYFSTSDPLVVSNNFITGCTYSVYMYQVQGINFIHNNMSSGSNLQMAYLENSSEINIWNNIFRNHTSSGFIYGATGTSNIVIDYNAYHYDTTVAMMTSASDFGTFTSPFDFMTGSSYDQNSMYQDPMFVNDTTDLHVSCSATALVAGAPVGITTDIDGLPRSTSMPTIGAHELAPVITNLLPDSTHFCGSVVLMSPYIGSYLWSTSETTQSITVSSAGMIYLTYTDACGNDTDDSTVVWTETPTAAFVWGTNVLQAVFNNQSIGGATYSWDFGDGNTSTQENPVHDYATGGTYHVVLTVTNACGGVDTTSQDLTISLAGIEEESLESRGINVYPNPTQGDVVVDFTLLLGEDITLIVTDMDGRIVYSDMISNQVGGYQKQLNLSNLSDGMYFLRVDTENESITKRIVKQ